MSKKKEQEALNEMVDEFAAALKEKLQSKYSRGWRGWDDDVYFHEFKKRCVHHAMDAILNNDDDQWIDVGNFAAFLWHQSRIRCESASCNSNGIAAIAKIEINEVVGDTSQKVSLCQVCADEAGLKHGDTV